MPTCFEFCDESATCPAAVFLDAIRGMMFRNEPLLDGVGISVLFFLLLLLLRVSSCCDDSPKAVGVGPGTLVRRDAGFKAEEGRRNIELSFLKLLCFLRGAASPAVLLSPILVGPALGGRAEAYVGDGGEGAVAARLQLLPLLFFLLTRTSW